MKFTNAHWGKWEVYIEDAITRKRLPEYNIKHTPPSPNNNKGLVELFVECQDDQEFKICCHYGPLKFDGSLIPSIDGRNISGYSLGASPLPTTCTFRTLFENVNGIVYEKSLKFCKLNKVEDGPKFDSATAMRLGTIELVLRGGKRILSSCSHMPLVSQGSKSVVDEKLKKLHLSSYVGGDTLRPATPTISYTLAASDRIPVYEIRFTYATRGILELREVIDPASNEERPNGASQFNENKARHSKKRKASDSRTTGEGSSVPRRRVEDDEQTVHDDDDIAEVEPAPAKKRKIHTVDLTNDDRPPIFVNLSNIDDDDDDDGVVDLTNDDEDEDEKPSVKTEVKTEAEPVGTK